MLIKTTFTSAQLRGLSVPLKVPWQYSTIRSPPETVVRFIHISLTNKENLYD